jgi:CelD/BcsL family acetyltransferase involved in cellulose biosynthesis
LRCEIVTDFARLEQLAPDWNRLWDHSLRRDIHTRLAWTRAWWRAYGTQVALHTPVVWQGDRLVGILPLVIKHKRLHFLGAPIGDYHDMICAGASPTEVLETALSAAVESSGRICVLDDLAQNSWVLSRWKGLSPGLQHRLQVVPRSNCPYLQLRPKPNDRSTFNPYDSRGRQLRNRLQRLGPIGFRHLEDRVQAHMHLENLFRQHAVRWGMHGQRSMFSKPGQRAFFQSLVDELDPVHELRFSVLELGGKPIAYHFGYEIDGRFFYYVPTFDVEYWDHTPGEVLLRNLLDYAIRQGLEEFDFMRGQEAYKERFTVQSIPSFTLEVFPSATRKASMILWQQAKAPARQCLHTLRTWGRVARDRLQTLCVKAGLAIPRGPGAEGSGKPLLFYRRRAASAASTGATGKSDVEFRKTALADLALMAAQNSGAFDMGFWRRARARLKQGDSLYVAYGHARPLLVAWMARGRTLPASSEPGEGTAVTLPEPGVVLHGCALLARRIPLHLIAQILDRLALMGLQESSIIWMVCPAQVRAWQRGLKRAGFTRYTAPCEIASRTPNASSDLHQSTG